MRDLIDDLAAEQEDLDRMLSGLDDAVVGHGHACRAVDDP